MRGHRNRGGGIGTGGPVDGRHALDVAFSQCQAEGGGIAEAGVGGHDRCSVAPLGQIVAHLDGYLTFRLVVLAGEDFACLLPRLHGSGCQTKY